MHKRACEHGDAAGNEQPRLPRTRLGEEQHHGAGRQHDLQQIEQAVRAGDRFEQCCRFAASRPRKQHELNRDEEEVYD